MSVVVDTNISGKEPVRQVRVSILVTSGSACSVKVRTLAWNARDVGSIPTLGATFSVFITPHDIGAVTKILYKLHAV